MNALWTYERGGGGSRKLEQRAVLLDLKLCLAALMVAQVLRTAHWNQPSARQSRLCQEIE